MAPVQVSCLLGGFLVCYILKKQPHEVCLECTSYMAFCNEKENLIVLLGSVITCQLFILTSVYCLLSRQVGGPTQ